MKTFKFFLSEETILLNEAKTATWGLNTTDAGKFHEVLTGGLVNHYATAYQANKSKGHKKAHEAALNAISQPPTIENKKKVKIAKISHMEKFRDEKANKSASEWHDHLSSKLNQSDYNEHLQHARHAATNIINHMHEQGITDIKKAHFTANANDIERLTNGKDSSKKGNNSDIVVEHGHKEGGGFHGVSLKSGGSSKLFNPGMGGISRVVDAAYEKAAGKKGSMSQSVAKADEESTAAHHKILNKHFSTMLSHFGASHVKQNKDKTVTISEHALNTMRYANDRLNSKNPEKTRVSELKGISQDKVKKLGNVYSELQSAKLNSYKHPVSSALNKHLTSIFNSTGAKAKQAQHDIITSLTNTPVREESNMRVMRHNTEMTKSGRKSKIAYGIGDALNKNHSYEIKKSGIANEIIGKDKDGNKTMHIRVVADASPSHGPGTGVRKGFHVWDMMKEPEKMDLNEEVLEEKRSRSDLSIMRQQRSQAAQERFGLPDQTAQRLRRIASANISAAAETKEREEYQKYNLQSKRSRANERQARELQTLLPPNAAFDFQRDLRESDQVSEEAPANAMGTAGISGAQTAVDSGIAGYDVPMGMVRRKPPKTFAGKAVFTVPSNDFYNATLGRKKGKHYRSYVKGELGEQVRQFALLNKDAPIILEDETTGAMMYLKYGKEK